MRIYNINYFNFTGKRQDRNTVNQLKSNSYDLNYINQIKISQAITVDEDFLDIPENMTDYNASIEIDGITHECVVKNSLKAGDEVLLLRKAGGQRYAVIDRVVV